MFEVFSGLKLQVWDEAVSTCRHMKQGAGMFSLVLLFRSHAQPVLLQGTRASGVWGFGHIGLILTL